MPAERVRPATCSAAAAQSGATASVNCFTRSMTVRSRRKTRQIARTTSGGPIHTGHVRKVAAPKIANKAIGIGAGHSSQTIKAHQSATAKHSDTTCARNECCANDPMKYARGSRSSRTAITANTVLGTSPDTSRRAIRNTRPHFSATVNATSGYTACRPSVFVHAPARAASR